MPGAVPVRSRPRRKLWIWIVAPAVAVFLAALTARIVWKDKATPADNQATQTSDPSEPAASRLVVVNIHPPSARLTAASGDADITGGDGTWRVRLSGSQSARLVARRAGYQDLQFELTPDSADSSFLSYEMQRAEEKVGEIHQFDGHTAPVRCVAISKDGKLAASGGDDEVIRLWNLETREPMGVWKAGQGTVLALAVSPNSKWLASAGADRTVRLWELPSGKLIRKLPEHAGRVEGVVFSPDGADILTATGSFDSDALQFVGCFAHLWNAKTGEEKMRYAGHQNLVTAAAFSPDGEVFATGCADAYVRLWKGKSAQTLVGHTGRVSSVAFSPDGRQVASASYDQTVRLWSAATGRFIRSLEGHQGSVHGVQFLDDRRLASVSQDKTLRIWEAATGEQIAQWDGHRAGVNGLAVSADLKYAVTAGSDRTVRLWRLSEMDGSPADAAAPIEIFSPVREFNSSANLVWDLSLSEDRRRFAAACSDRAVRVWNLDDAVPIAVLQDPEDVVYAVAWDQLTDRLVCSCRNKFMYQWDASNWQLTKSWRHADVVQSIYLPEGTALAYTVGKDGQLQSWKIKENDNANFLFSAGSPLRSLAGRTNVLAFAGDDGTLYIGDVAQNLVIRRFRGHKSPIHRVALGPDGNWVATASDDGTVRLWEIATGKQLRQWTVEGERMRAIALSPDQKLAASATDSGVVLVWEIESEQLRYRLIGHRGYVTDLEFTSPTELLSSSRDGTCRLWRLTPGLGRK